MRNLLPTAALILAAGLTLLGPVIAQDKPPAAAAVAAAPDDAIEVSTRVYEVGDLLRPTDNYPLEPTAPPVTRHSGAEAGPNAATPPTASAAAEAADYLTSLIRETIAVGSWKEDGGSIGSMRVLSSSASLIVTQTPATHKQINALLVELRKQRGVSTMISTRVYWVLMDPKVVDSLFDPVAVGNAPKHFATVDDDTLAHRATLYCQSQTTCFNGQTVSIQSGREWSAVTGLTPVVGTQALGYQPTIETIRSGVTLQLTPQLGGEENSVVLDLHSTVTESRPPTKDAIGVPATTQPVARDAEAMSGITLATIDRTDIVRQTFATTARVPLGKRVLIAGMTLQPASGETQPRHLYLLVQADAVK